MPYLKPTADEFATAFPSIVSTPEVISFWIDIAAMMIDTSWHIDDYQPAILFLAAHYLTMQIAADAAAAAGGGATSGGSSSEETTGAVASYLSSVSIEGRTVSFRQAGPTSRSSQSASQGAYTSASDTALRRSLYGQIFIELRRRNVAPILTV